VSTDPNLDDSEVAHILQARSFGVMRPDEEAGVRQMIIKTVNQLERASVSPHDLGSRYARLLELLWLKPKSNGTNGTPAIQPPPIMPSSGSLQPSPLADPTYMEFSPAYDFSWLDLEAVGDYVISADHMATGTGPLPIVDTSGTLHSDATAYVPTQDARTSWQMYNNWPAEVNGTLLF
jgi:hypothetical protein